MSTHPTNYGFSRLKRPPIPGRVGTSKAKATMFGVNGVFGPDDNGMYTLRTTAQATPHHMTAQDIRVIASPDADVAIYVSATGCHSVVRYDDQDWAVIAIKAKYKHYPVLGPQDPSHTIKLYQDVVVIKPGTTVKHAAHGVVEEVTWPGLSEESKKFVQECIEEHAFK